MGFFAAIWGIQKGILAVVGNTIMVIVGIAMCGYAMAQQYEQLHNTTLDVILLVVGLSLISFRMVRHFIWDVIFLTIPWLAIVAGGVYLLTVDSYRFEITPAHILLAFAPPILLAALIEFLPKSAQQQAEEAHQPHLEIHMDTPLADEPLIDDETHHRE